MKKKLAMILTVVLVLMVIAPTALAAQGRVMAASKLNVRSSPSTSSAILGKYNNDDVITLDGTSGDWFKTPYSNKTAYVYQSLVYKLPETVSSMAGTVTTSLNVRSGPGTSYSKVGNPLSKNKQISFSKGPYPWYKLDGKDQFVHSSYVKQDLNGFTVEGTFSTSFDEGKVGRSNNLSRASWQINGTILAPGEAFSFNGVVGKRTFGKGYMVAPVIIQGKLIDEPDGPGGGVCQVSTTLKGAARRCSAGMFEIKSQKHSIEVGYVKNREDEATVSWGGPDLTLKNISKKTLYLFVTVSSGKVTATICSKK